MCKLALERAEGLVFTLMYEIPSDDFRINVESNMSEEEVKKLRRDYEEYDKRIGEHIKDIVTCDIVTESRAKYLTNPNDNEHKVQVKVLKNVKVRIPEWLATKNVKSVHESRYMQGARFDYTNIPGAIFDYSDIVGKVEPGKTYDIEDFLTLFDIPKLVVDSLVVIDCSEDYSDIQVMVDENYIRREVDKALGTLEEFRELVNALFETGLCGFKVSEGDGWYDYLTEVLSYDKETDMISYMLDRGDRIGWSDNWEYQSEEGEVSLEDFYNMCKNRVFGSQEAQVSFSTSLMDAVNRGGFYG